MPAQTTIVNGLPYFTLNNGEKMPSVGIGCWMGAGNSPNDAEEMCKNALKCGYRHIDTAAGYGNEEVVGKAIRESGIPRNEIFVTTKLWSAFHDKAQVQEAFERSFKALNIEYIDLYLMHWPQAIVDGRTLAASEHPTFIETWKAMEALLTTGKVKSIGVSNFSIPHLETLLPHCSVIPVVNQVEVHPCLPNEKLRKWCEEKGMILTAYSPFGQGNPHFFNDPDVLRVAQAHNAQVGQTVISWCVQRGIAAVPKSSNPVRMQQNKELVALTPDEVSTISSIYKKQGMHRSLLTYPGGPGGAFGWTYADLGWPFAHDGEVLPESGWE